MKPAPKQPQPRTRRRYTVVLEPIPGTEEAGTQAIADWLLRRAGLTG